MLFEAGANKETYCEGGRHNLDVGYFVIVAVLSVAVVAEHEIVSLRELQFLVRRGRECERRDCHNDVGD